MTTYINGRAYVRCLGPGREHWFFSKDRCRHRVCDRCKRKMNLTQPSPITEHIFVVNPEHRTHSTAERND